MMNAKYLDWLERKESKRLSIERMDYIERIGMNPTDYLYINQSDKYINLLEIHSQKPVVLKKNLVGEIF